ncbi:MAG: hypothetical protein JXA90_16590, partial [Planctomycetes bacterium]|nr:hypothetical protein [Planctomycetota bacterium]
MPTPHDVLFGKIAVRNRLVEEAQIKQCLALLERDGNGKPLGKLLLERGMISPGQFRAIEAHVQKTVGAAGGEPE